MVNATVDNEPVSIQLNPGQSTTVPSGEVWKVQITVAILGSNRNFRKGGVDINGVPIIGATTSGDHQGQVAPNTVLKAGDTITNGAQGASISGFVIS